MQFAEFSLTFVSTRSGNGITSTTVTTIEGTIFVVGKIVIITVGDTSILFVDGKIVSIV